MSKKLKCLSILMAASVITASVSTIPAMAENQTNINEVSINETGTENEVVWGEDQNYSWPSNESNTALINGIAFKLEDSGELTIVPSRVVAPYLGNNKSGYEDVSGNLVLPFKVKIDGKYYSVTKIDDYSFFNCKTLTSVVISDSIKSIGHNAFYLDDSLAKVVLSKNLEEMYDNSFNSCYVLDTISISSENK